MAHALRYRSTNHERTPQSRKRHSDKRITLGTAKRYKEEFRVSQNVQPTAGNEP